MKRLLWLTPMQYQDGVRRKVENALRMISGGFVHPRPTAIASTSRPSDLDD
jgi:hypothetical protein